VVKAAAKAASRRWCDSVRPTSEQPLHTSQSSHVITPQALHPEISLIGTESVLDSTDRHPGHGTISPTGTGNLPFARFLAGLRASADFCERMPCT
jgi:hypothetical protein